jgi:ankyrin repeat protein
MMVWSSTTPPVVMPLKIPGIPFVITTHQPMAPPKGDDGQRIADATLIQRLAHGGPLPLKIRRTKDSDESTSTTPPRTSPPQRFDADMDPQPSQSAAQAQASTAVTADLAKAMTAHRKEIRQGRTSELDVKRELLTRYVQEQNMPKIDAMVSQMAMGPNDTEPSVPAPLIESAINKGDAAMVASLLASDSARRPMRRDRKTLPLALRNGRNDIADLLLAVRRTDITHDAVVAAVQTGNAGMLAKLSTTAEARVLAHALDDLLVFPTSIRGNDATLRQLIAALPNPNVRHSGAPPLTTAVSHDVRAAVEALLAHPMIDVNATDKKRATALHAAASSPGRTDVLRMLLEHPRINVDAVNSEGLSPLDLARREGHAEAVQMLREHDARAGARPTSSSPAAISKEDCDTLGVRADASVGEIRKAYHARAKGLHPDRGGTKEQFQELQNAYENAIKARGSR